MALRQLSRWVHGASTRHSKRSSCCAADFWGPSEMAAYLDAVPDAGMIILVRVRSTARAKVLRRISSRTKCQSTTAAPATVARASFGVRYVRGLRLFVCIASLRAACQLHNFGGGIGLFGELPVIMNAVGAHAAEYVPASGH
jgi:hypothetical protein